MPDTIKRNLGGGLVYEAVEFYEGLRSWGEPDTEAWMVKNVKPDWYAVDVGANVGMLTILLGKLTPRGRVYALEPNPNAHAMLIKNLKHNGLGGRVEAWNVAAGDRNDSETKVLWLSGIGGGSSYTNRRAGEFKMITLDSAFAGAERLDLIKIDVDGWDMEVIWGSEKVISECRPFIIVEINYALGWRKHTMLDVLETLERLNYTLVDILDGINWVLAHRSRQDEITMLDRPKPPRMIERFTRILDCLMTCEGMAS